MDLKVEINAEDLNKQVTEAIAKSAIGEALKEQIDKTVVEMSKGWNNPYENIIKQHISQEIEKVLSEDYQEAMNDFVKSKMTDEFVQSLFTKVFEAAERRY